MRVVHVREAALSLLWIFLISITWSVSKLSAQPTESNNSRAGGLQLENMANGNPGGGAGANFSQLMMLIQQTIDPNDWIDNSNTMSPFPNGVYIDPAGQLKHLSSDPRALWLALSTSASELRLPWRTESPLRIVSLRKLDRALGEIAAGGLRASHELTHLAGLSRIEYVQVDVANEDVLLAGPATAGRAGVPQGFYLADLALFVELISSRTTPFGCSIDPTDAGILAAQELLKPVAAWKRLAHNPKKFVGQMHDKIGLHHVRVFGMPANSPAAMALVLADEHMKQLGFETAQTPVAIDSYFEHLDRQADVPAQSLVRWWFAFANEPIRANEGKDRFQLPNRCVALFSEQQWMSLAGLKPTGEQDAAADAFAKGMTEALDKLREAHPAYARLCAMFESALALQLVLESNGQHDLHAWFPNLQRYGQAACDPQMELKSVTGLTAWHKLKQGTVVAVVSGGVRIDAKSLASPEHWRAASQEIDLPQSSTRFDGDSKHWWWD